MQNNSKYTINSHRFHLSGSQSLSHIATIPFHLWFIYMVFPLSLPCLWPWVRLEIMHQPSSLHHPSCCQSSLLKINSENHVISLISFPLYGFVWHSKSSTIWVYCGFPAYLFLKNYFNPNILQKIFPDPLNVFPPLPQAFIHLQVNSHDLPGLSSSCLPVAFINVRPTRKSRPLFFIISVFSMPKLPL